MDNRIKIARQLVRIARELVANELVILPYDGESLRIDEPVRVVNADDSNIGNKTDRFQLVHARDDDKFREEVDGHDEL